MDVLEWKHEWRFNSIRMEVNIYKNGRILVLNGGVLILKWR